jgi:hypothetical protein
MVPLLVCAVGLASPPAVRLDVDAGVHDAGTVRIGVPLSHTFRLKNPSDRHTVTIRNIATPCGCLTQKLEKSTLAPGESTTWSVALNTLTQPEGDHGWQIRYMAEVPDGGMEQSIAIKAKLVREIAVTPPMISFSTTGEANQAIAIDDLRTKKPLPITSAESTSKDLAVTVVAGRATVSLAATAPADGTLKRETVTIRTDDPTYRELKIPVSYVKNATDGLAITPAKIEFLRGTTPSVAVQLRDPAGRLLTIESATADQSFIATRFSPGANPVVAVRATLDATTAPTTGSGWLTVRFADGRSRAIPVTWK